MLPQPCKAVLLPTCRMRKLKIIDEKYLARGHTTPAQCDSAFCSWLCLSIDKHPALPDSSLYHKWASENNWSLSAQSTHNHKQWIGGGSGYVRLLFLLKLKFILEMQPLGAATLLRRQADCSSPGRSQALVEAVGPGICEDLHCGLLCRSRPNANLPLGGLWSVPLTLSQVICNLQFTNKYDPKLSIK